MGNYLTQIIMGNDNLSMYDKVELSDFGGDSFNVRMTIHLIAKHNTVVKIVNVIKTSKTEEHFKGANNLINLFFKKYKDFDMAKELTKYLNSIKSGC